MNTLHFISHTHWDREWYLPFEKLRIRLVDLIDHLLDILDNNPDFKYYHLDGQTILIEDYLEIKPQNKEKLMKYIEEGRIKIGPWYVLQDEYLTSGEANIRNLMLGLKQGKKYGGCMKIGYFPDAFGNISQAPQILTKFDISNAVFGRGISPCSDNNNKNEYPSEIYWESPDGSRVLGIFMANWYNNASEIPDDYEESLSYILKAQKDARKYATTKHLLMMNGCDHQPIQENLPEILARVQEEIEDELLHSNLEKYIRRVKKETDNLPVVSGELNNQYSDGNFTLRNTASSRVYLKQCNNRNQVLLEKYVEPLESYAWIKGKKYEKEFIWQAWKYLMQNHPHDSICGCSIDDVHQEMVTRFKKSIQICESLLERSHNHIVNYLSEDDTVNNVNDTNHIIVYNTLNWERTDLVEVELKLPEDKTLEDVILIDSNDQEVPVDVEDLGIVFDYELPDNSFRKVNYKRKYKLRFIAVGVPPNGFKTYFVKEISEDNHSKKPGGNPDKNILENEYLKLLINSSGSIDIYDKENNNNYESLNIYEDSADTGDEYIYRAPESNEIITTRKAMPSIKRLKATEVETIYLIKDKINLPVECVEDGENSFRSSETRSCSIKTYISLKQGVKRVDIRTVFDNKVKDHRLRAIFPVDFKTKYHYTDAQFDVLKRPNEPWPGWENPSHCYRQQVFIDISNGQAGLMIASKGLHEYEILSGDEDCIALTLLRSIGEMGDWGVFPTPDAQCQGIQQFEYSIIPHQDNWLRSKVYKDAYNFKASLLGYQMNNRIEKNQASSLFTINNDHIVLSGLKKSEERESLILRVYNIAGKDEDVKIKFYEAVENVYITNLKEEREEKINVVNNKFKDRLKKKEIKTYEITFPVN